MTRAHEPAADQPGFDPASADPRRGRAGQSGFEDYNSPVAVERRLALAVQMLDAAVLELRTLMSQLQATTTTTTTTSSGVRHTTATEDEQP